MQAASDLGGGTSLIAFETTLWESGGIDTQVPARATNPLKITRRVVVGEHDPTSVKLLNVTDRELQVRVVVDKVPSRPTVVPSRSVEAPTSQGGTAWDPLTGLDESSVISIPSFSTREVWLDAKFDRARPGEHLVRVRFQAAQRRRSLGRVGQLAQRASAGNGCRNPLPCAAVRDEPRRRFRLCCWASLGPAEIADLLDHGNNVFCVPPGEAKYDAQGHIASVDYTRMDAILAKLRGHDVVALVQGKLGLRSASGTPQYAADMKAALVDLVAHMAKMGLDRDHFAPLSV